MNTKRLTILTVLLFTFTSFSAFSDKGETARNLYGQRGEDFHNAKLAADLYGELDNETSAEQYSEKANWKVRQSQALYFYALHLTVEEEKVPFFKQGYQIADEAIRLLTNGDEFSATPKTPDLKEELAEAHYFSAINRGRWAAASNLTGQLVTKHWPLMKKHISAAESNDITVHHYGPDRAFGRAAMKIGSIFVPLKLAETSLTRAYTETIHPKFNTSTFALNTVFYLDLLVRTGDNDTAFCEAYRNFTALQGRSDEELEELSPGLLPETKITLQSFQAGKGFLEDIHGHHSLYCEEE